MQKLMLIENDGPEAVSLRDYLSELGYKVSVIVKTAEQAVENAKIFHPDFIVMDYALNKQIDGKTIYEKIRQYNNDIPIIYMTTPVAVS